MSKSNFSSEYQIFRELLRDLRVRKGITQVQLSSALGMAQSFVSKYEIGERRLDFVEVDRICRELGTSLESFARVYVNDSAKASGNGRAKPKKGEKRE